MKKTWLGFWAVIIVSFVILGWIGFRIYQEVPPIPARVVTTSGITVIGPGEITEGQNVWQAMGGMEIGTVWGHGSYVAPDWTADWLHRECVYILDHWSMESAGKHFDSLGSDQQSFLISRLTRLMKTNSFDPATGTITIDPLRAGAFDSNVQHYREVFSDGNVPYSIPRGTVTDSTKVRRLASFIFWTSWAASTNRPGGEVTYTSNWPHEALVGNVPSADSIIWTGVSIIFLLAGIGGMVWYHASQVHKQEMEPAPIEDPLLAVSPTPSQKAVVKYFWVVSGLMFVQIIAGIITAHYGVEGNAFYGISLAQWLPYVITRTWHVQIGIFWIATAWLAAGLYIAPLVSGVELKGQRLGVNLLFTALLLVVLGSLAGEWLSVFHKLTGDAWFYFGHQGYEYVDLGRVWQIGLVIGLFFWVFLVGRNIIIAIRKNTSEKSLLYLFLIASLAIAIFYIAGLMWGKHTNLALVEYWRWWVVHLWVEGFFEVFATVVIAFMFVRLKLIYPATCSQAVVLSATIFLAGGIVGTLHHLYFSGTPISVIALGSVFSALEVVPLTLVGYEAWGNLRLSRSAPWVQKYKWPVYYFIAVAFWNLVGAGLFGFMINPPIALYYMQGLNTTPLHGHAALFGVYGMLGIGLMLFCLRVLWVRAEWKEGFLKFSFWAQNLGLMMMVLLSLLPVGLLQTWASVKYGYWYARSTEFMESGTVQVFRWMRVPGDTIFALGSTALIVFVFGIALGKFTKK